MLKKFFITEQDKKHILSLYKLKLNEQTNRSLTFTVKSDNGETIPGASVIIYNSQGKAIDGTSTNDEGKATITATPQSFKFGVGFVGYKNYQQELSPTETNYNITLTSDELKTLDIQEQNDINLFVKDDEGVPLSKVKIIYTGIDDKEVYGETDENGKFKKSGIKKESEIKISKKGYEPEFIDFKGDPLEMTFTLKPLVLIVVDSVTDETITNSVGVINGEEFVINNELFKNNDFKFPITIIVKKDGYTSKTIDFNGISSKKIGLDKPEPPKPKQKSWRDEMIEAILETERTLKFTKEKNVTKYVQVSIENLYMYKDGGLDSVVVVGNFPDWEDKVVLVLDCNGNGTFELLSYPKEKYVEGQKIEMDSLSLGKRYGKYINKEFFSYLKNNLKLCGLNYSK